MSLKNRKAPIKVISMLLVLLMAVSLTCGCRAIRAKRELNKPVAPAQQQPEPEAGTPESTVEAASGTTVDINSELNELDKDVNEVKDDDLKDDGLSDTEVGM